MGYADGGPVTNAEDLEFMTQLENNRNEVDPMSDSRYAGLLKQNQDYLSKIYGNIYNQPTPQLVESPPPVATAPSAAPTPLTGAVAPPPPPPTPVTPPVFFGAGPGGPVTSADDLDFMTKMENNRNEVDPMSDPRYAGLLKQNQNYLSKTYGNIYDQPPSPPLDIETVRANANRALDFSDIVRDSSRDISRAVEKALAVGGGGPTPPPVYQSPNATPAGQYMIRNPYGPEPLNASNIYQYQKKKQRGYAEGGDIQEFGFGGFAQIKPLVEEFLAKQDAENAAKAAEAAKNAPTPPPVVTAPPLVSNDPTLPPPTFSPKATSSGQYLVSNPYDTEPLSAANIYEYQKKQRGYAEGGVPRFLSGGGDGMSDSIKASIEGTQEARLADGEFVIPADVVSHLGNGSSKAGAKQLYDMMDRVRKARTGNRKQGREIKPTKLMPV